MSNTLGKIHLNADFFFYAGLFLITFDAFPFDKYGLGSGKPLSIIPFLMYFIIKCFSLRSLAPSRKDICLWFCVFTLLFMSGIYGIFYGDMSGFSRAVSMFAVFVITVTSFNFFISGADSNKIIKMCQTVLKSFDIALFFGVLEIIHFYIYPINIVPEFIECFVRDDVFLDVKKLQFNFGEAGNCAIMLGILLPIILYLLNRHEYKIKKIEKIKIFFIYAISIFSFSINYLLIMTFFLVFGGIFYLCERQRRRANTITAGILLAVLCILFLRSPFFEKAVSDSNLRAINMLTDLRYVSLIDPSTQTRIGQMQIGIESFTSRPLTGYGWGYYNVAFRENYDKLNYLLDNNELREYYYSKDLQTHGFIFSAMAEGGIIGIFFILLILSRIKFRNSDFLFKAIVVLFVIELLQCIFLYWISLIIPYCILSSKEIGDNLHECQQK